MNTIITPPAVLGVYEEIDSEGRTWTVTRYADQKPYPVKTTKEMASFSMGGGRDHTPLKNRRLIARTGDFL